jgi:hypothetical protein
MFAMSNRRSRVLVILRAVNDNNHNGKPAGATNRRRAAQIVHDDRGNARVEWIDAGAVGVELERAPLSIEPTPNRGQAPKLTVERARAGGFDPYHRVGHPTHTSIPEAKKPQAKRDLRKLGEWIKLKRELEARKPDDDTE